MKYYADKKLMMGDIDENGELRSDAFFSQCEGLLKSDDPHQRLMGRIVKDLMPVISRHIMTNDFDGMEQTDHFETALLTIGQCIAVIGNRFTPKGRASIAAQAMSKVAQGIAKNIEAKTLLDLSGLPASEVSEIAKRLKGLELLASSLDAMAGALVETHILMDKASDREAATNATKH